MTMDERLKKAEHQIKWCMFALTGFIPPDWETREPPTVEEYKAMLDAREREANLTDR